MRLPLAWSAAVFSAAVIIRPSWAAAAAAATPPNLQSAVFERLTHVNITKRVEEGLWPPPRSYRAYKYEEILQLLNATASSYPHLVKLYTAQEAFPDVSLTADFFTCPDGKKCLTHVVEVGNREAPDWRLLPEMFISGAVHGDERVGPVVAVELLLLLSSLYGTNPVVTYLLNTRRLVMIPMTNVHGFAHNSRTENNIDPNRDFGYGVDPRSCMQTITARVVNELFRRHLFQSALTFHGGTRVLSYEWGSYDHANKNPPHGSGLMASGGYVSAEAPDAQSQLALGNKLQEAAGRLRTKDHPFQRFESYGYRRLSPTTTSLSATTTLPSSTRGRLPDGEEDFYPKGPMSDLVYPVNGGFEDWSYAASWAGTPPVTGCQPKTYGGYPVERTQDYGDSVRCSTFLVETDYFKNPPLWQMGHSLEVFSTGILDGHVSRNIRLSLKLLEMTRPDLLLAAAPRLGEEGKFLELKLLAAGCETLDEVQAIVVDAPCESLRAEDYADPELQESPTLRIYDLGKKAINCTALSVWEWDYDAALVQGNLIDVKVPVNPTNGTAGTAGTTGCVWLRAAFDQHWSKQTAPEPALPPQTHIARSRLENEYTGESQEAEIRAHRLDVFPRRLGWGAAFVGGIDLRVIQAKSQEPPQILTPVATVQLPALISDSINERAVWTVDFFAAEQNASTLSSLDRWDPLQQQDWLAYGSDGATPPARTTPRVQQTEASPRLLNGDADPLLSAVALNGVLPKGVSHARVNLRLFRTGNMLSPDCPVDVNSLSKDGVPNCGDGLLLEADVDAEDAKNDSSSTVKVEQDTGSFSVVVAISEMGLRLSKVARRLVVAELLTNTKDDNASSPEWISLGTAQWKGPQLKSAALCVLTPTGALVSNDDERYPLSWYEDSDHTKLLAREVARHALGQLVIYADGSLEVRACNVHEAFESLRLEPSSSSCDIALEVKRGEAHFLNPLASRTFTGVGKTEICAEGSTLHLIGVGKEEEEISLAQCQVVLLNDEAKSNQPQVCTAESAVMPGSAKLPVGPAVAVAAACAAGILTVVVTRVVRRRRNGYAVAPQ